MDRRRVTRLDEFYFVARHSKRISWGNSSKRETRLVPIFILEKHNQRGYKHLPKLVHASNAYENTYENSSMKN